MTSSADKSFRAGRVVARLISYAMIVAFIVAVACGVIFQSVYAMTWAILLVCINIFVGLMTFRMSMVDKVVVPLPMPMPQMPKPTANRSPMSPSTSAAFDQALQNFLAETRKKPGEQ